ncbi:MAG: hypothetical protein KJP00_01060 [Bacteroidia bacterium]|nr:hypothetical protein [Bacteroidia bacterium]
MNYRIVFIMVILVFLSLALTTNYPIDGYTTTGIRRLDRLEKIFKGEIKGRLPIKGALKSIEEIQLNLLGARGDSLQKLPKPDPGLQKALEKLFPRLDESYSVSLLDITPDKPIAYAHRQHHRGFQPGSVGKLAVITAFMTELSKIYPYCFVARQELLRDKVVRAGRWAIYDEHTVPFWNPGTSKYFRRQVQERDTFSLYEWADHMMSVSNNGAASVVWREAILMRTFVKEYPKLTEERADSFFLNTAKRDLAELAITVIRESLCPMEIMPEEWRLGTFFTRGGEFFIPRKGGSIGSPAALMKWMIALERGLIVDLPTSLEIKRLLYMTGRRIRYASNKSLVDAAVYFKSGSLYSCRPEQGYSCGKYRGNSKNYMNSVAIVEHPDGVTYMIALMSNVLRKNSNIDHNMLAGNIDRIVKARHLE